MKQFHISDVLTVTTGKLVSSRHIDGVYELLNFLTGDNLFTHQLPRAARECEPWMRTQFPQLFPEDPRMGPLLERLKISLESEPETRKDKGEACARWVKAVQEAYGLPELLPVYEMGADMQTHIDPIEEAEAMVGKDRVIVVEGS